MEKTEKEIKSFIKKELKDFNFEKNESILICEYMLKNDFDLTIEDFEEFNNDWYFGQWYSKEDFIKDDFYEVYDIEIDEDWECYFDFKKYEEKEDITFIYNNDNGKYLAFRNR